MLPWVIMFNSVSLDGRITGFNADVDLYYELASKLDFDAVLMGSNTLLTEFNAQPGELREADEVLNHHQVDPEDQRPILVVPDSKGQIRIWNEVFKMPYVKDILVLCSRSTPQEYLDFLDEQFIKYMIVGYQQVDLETALDELNLQFGVKSVRVDREGIINGILLKQGLVDEVHVLIHPQLAGGSSSSSIYQTQDLIGDEGIIQLKLNKIQEIKENIVWLQYEVLK
jgi:2,5-diamino-6-(ribosylamino)-4(3H)-pyrimidinone 5'-phosphate reductase